MKVHNPEFVKKILASHQSMLEGKTTRININDIWNKDYQKKNSSKK